MKITDVWFDADRLYITCDSGEAIGHPLAWYPRLGKAFLKKRRNWHISPWGDVIRWEALDEDLSPAGFLHSDSGMLVPKHEQRCQSFGGSIRRLAPKRRSGYKLNAPAAVLWHAPCRNGTIWGAA